MKQFELIAALGMLLFFVFVVSSAQQQPILFRCHVCGAEERLFPVRNRQGGILVFPCLREFPDGTTCDQGFMKPVSR